MAMILNEEQKAILDGARGETMAKVMKTLVMYGEAFGAEKLVPVTSEYNHLVTSFGLGVLEPVYELMEKLIPDAGLVKLNGAGHYSWLNDPYTFIAVLKSFLEIG